MKSLSQTLGSWDSGNEMAIIPDERNYEPFLEDFMIGLNEEDSRFLRSQSVTLNLGRGQHRKYYPFTLAVFDVIRQFMNPPARKSRRIGFKVDEDKK